MRYAFSVFLLLIPILSNASEASEDYTRVAYWTFDTVPDGKVSGTIDIAESDLNASRYPGFDEENRSLSIKAPSYIELSDGANDKFDFDNDDAITVEAWVNLNSIADQAYIISKGRTASNGPLSIDQNWAVRLRKRNGMACLNFLFRSRADQSDAGNPSKGEWHRWTTKDGFVVGHGWHHIAVSYRFGDPKSIRGFLDGKKVVGDWDMGGKTTRPPARTKSPIWIGSAMAGNRGNSFDGRLDELAVYRGEVPDDILKSRYKFTPAPVVRPDGPRHSVVNQLFGPIDSLTHIPALHPDAPVNDWRQSAMGFTRLPHHYDSWGVRDDWNKGSTKTMFVRSWADLDLESGDYQFLVRSRGYSRLFVDGKEIVSTPRMRNRTGAHHVVTPLPEVPIPGMRPAFMNDHERIVDFHSDGGNHELRFEAIVGGPKYRMEFGETCVAIARRGEMFHLVSTQKQYPLTDSGWNRFTVDQSEQLDRLDRKIRRAKAATQNDYWHRRHAYAKEHLLSGTNANSIDKAIRQQIKIENRDRTKNQSDTPVEHSSSYTREIQPILQTHCARCHDQKTQGELAIFDRDNLLRGGESGGPAVVPGKPAESYLVDLISANENDYRMPPKGDGLSTAEIASIKRWISEGAQMPAAALPPIQLTPEVDDYVFLRRVFIDTVGVPPSIAEANAFLSDNSERRKENLVNRQLDDPRWADNWVGYWQDVLAENPNLLKPTLNNTGPFRYWIYESLDDNKPIDRFATELIQMRGSKWYGGAAGFAVASQNDAPMAAKAHIISTAFMGVEMKCARCHDAPYHSWKQSDLFRVAAMLQREPIKLPATSTVPAAFFDQQERESLIKVTLKPGQTVHGEWPFAQLAPAVEQSLLQSPNDSRERLAAQVTASRRFAEVIANRIWRRLVGRAIVEPVDDWEGNAPSNPLLLQVLADQLIHSDYDLKALTRQILLSKAYRRTAVKRKSDAGFFAGPTRRRMTAEQIVDSAFHVTGQLMRTEQLTLDVEGTLPEDKFMNFGFPSRSWEFSTLANERDRPSLALPRVQAITDVLKAFGWRNSRPEPTSARDETPNLGQPGALANGTLGLWLTRLSDENGLTDMMLKEQSVKSLVDQLFLRLLTRRPTSQESTKFVELLSDGFHQRIRTNSMAKSFEQPKRFRYVSWSNHLNSDANVIKVQMQEQARSGPPPTQRLEPIWREKAEDAIWALLNSPESILIP